MNRTVATAAAGVGAFVLVAGVAVGEYALHQSGTITARTVTVGYD